MRSQQLRFVTQNSTAPAIDYRDDTRLLQQRIAGISSLVASLNAAIEDLEATELPTMTEEFDFYNEVERFERRLIQGALRRTGGSQVKAAKLLKLNPTTLNSKIKSLNILAGTLTPPRKEQNEQALTAESDRSRY